MADSICRWRNASFSAVPAVNHTDNNVNCIVNAHEVYSLHTYPSRMLSTHQEFLSFNNMSLINVRSTDFLLYIYRDFENYCNRVINTLLAMIRQDIISINFLYKQKKEVNERKMTLKHSINLSIRINIVTFLFILRKYAKQQTHNSNIFS